ncbi:hypothetical protein [Arcobacter sp.]|uniref:hypothetical protein n=1 Tax=Arcobacter sp. TaxID=1872629 RepID=UPI003D0C9A05
MNIKILVITLTVLLGVNCFADKPQKNIPSGLQKKVQKGKPLPPGWQKKIAKGEVLDLKTLSTAKIVYSTKYPKINGTKIYELENKIFRVMSATREILEVLK